jgi:hypothetical protein
MPQNYKASYSRSTAPYSHLLLLQFLIDFSRYLYVFASVWWEPHALYFDACGCHVSIASRNDIFILYHLLAAAALFLAVEAETDAFLAITLFVAV